MTAMLAATAGAQKDAVVILGPDPAPAYTGPKGNLTARYASRDYQMYAALFGPVQDFTGPEHFVVGYLVFDQHHQVAVVEVRPEFQRLGIATMLWNTAKADQADLRHSDEMTAGGRAWVKSLGDWLAARAAVLQPPTFTKWPPLAFPAGPKMKVGGPRDAGMVREGP